VITLEGICPQPAAAGGAACRTVVTKEEFEKLVDALNPEMTAQVRRQLANAYGQMLMLATSAEERGLADTPAAREMLHFSRLQALSQVLVRQVQEEAANIPPAEMEKYYQEHGEEFEEATMRRIFIPKVSEGEENEQPVRLDEAQVKTTAATVHKRAMSGEDFEKLQEAAYTELKVTDPPPSARPTTVKREQMPQIHIAAFNMKQGEISKLFEDASGVYIYKMESKRSIPLEAAKPQIQQALQEARMQSGMQEVTKGVRPQLSEEYFGQEEPAPGPGMPEMPQGHP
jgi:uncharacterized protein (DUF2267 family)